MAARAARIGRLERPAMTGVLVREVVNFSSYWRSTTFCVAMPAWSVPGTHNTFSPFMRW